MSKLILRKMTLAERLLVSGMVCISILLLASALTGWGHKGPGFLDPSFWSMTVARPQ